MERTDVWADLSDSELRLKLWNRGVSSGLIDRLVRHPDDPNVAAAIDNWMWGQRP